MTNKKEGETDRVVAAIPLAVTANLQPEVTPLGCELSYSSVQLTSS